MWSGPRTYNQYSWSIESVEFCKNVEKSWRYNSAMEYSPGGDDVSTEAEESPLLRSVTRKRLVKGD
jgi:hypothetical protein